VGEPVGEEVTTDAAGAQWQSKPRPSITRP
jgi:hypothetical protein